MAFHPRLPPMRNDTSVKPSRRTRRATIEAAAGIHIRAQNHDKLPRIMSVSNTVESGIRMAKYMASPQRAWSRLSCLAAGAVSDALMRQPLAVPYRILFPVSSVDSRAGLA
jgi:hypothetical protein